MSTTRAPLRRIADFLRGRPSRPNAGGVWPDYRAILGNFLVPRGTAVAVDTPAAWERVLAAPGLPASWARRDPVFVNDPFRGLYGERNRYHPHPRRRDLPAALSIPRTRASRVALAAAADRAAFVEELWRETAARFSAWDHGSLADSPVLWSSSAASRFPRRVAHFARDTIVGLNRAADAPVNAVSARLLHMGHVERLKFEATSRELPPPPLWGDPAHAQSDNFFARLLHGDWHWRQCVKLGLSVPGTSHDLAGEPFAGLPNPFDPALALLNEGFAWAVDLDLVVLVAPEF